MMLYFLNSRIPIEIETHEDYLWVQSKFYQDCCLMLSSSLCPRSVKSLDLFGVVLDSYSRTLFCPNSPSRKMLVWVHQASSLNGESRQCVCGILTSFDDSLCTYDNSAAKNWYSIHYMYSLHWVLTIFFVINVFCCIYWEFVVVGGFVELLLHCIVSNLFPVDVGLMNPYVLDFQITMACYFV